ncbi:MAG: thioredoxin family protein, partial [Candidatus Hydrogenedentes bacterium]|nr:thioredoxin family protein [Candidatus Hydrogenedentota bacterium]
AFIDAAESGRGFEQAGFLAGKSAWLVIAITLAGGLLLNLTPCVLPLIPVNLAIIGAGAQSGSRGRGFLLGGTYGAGIALLYGALGLIVVLGASSFGAINASPWFNFAIAAIFVLLGLALFDLFLIDFTRFQAKIGLKPAHGAFLFAFFMGLINALLAGACVAPVVIMVVLYSQDAYAKGATVALALPFLLGAGMALPWPLAGAGLSLLPKPGKWMVRVKHAFGVFILAMAVYYGYLGASLFSERYLVDPEAVRASAHESDEDGWVASLEEGLALAAAENRPVLIDFWATWCKNCLTMNKTTLKDPGVQERLAEYVKIKFQAEIPDQPPARDVLSRFDYVGLPHYAILEPPA